MRYRPTGEPDCPRRYEIRLGGRLDPRWAARFHGMTLTTTGDGTTVLDGPVVDQAALHGLLRTVYDAGLPLLSVNEIDADHPEHTPPARDFSSPED